MKEYEYVFIYFFFWRATRNTNKQYYSELNTEQVLPYTSVSENGTKIRNGSEILYLHISK